MKKTLQRITALLAILTTSVLVLPAPVTRPAHAGSLSTAIVGMFPKNVGEFAYADLKTAHKYPWFAQVREQLLPSRFRQFEQFLTSAGVDPNTQVEELAWGAIEAKGSNAEQIVGVALGNFSPSSVEERFKQQKLPSINVHGYNLFAFGTGSGANDILFFFLDSNTAAFGHRAALEKLIGVRFGESESLLDNDQLFPLINEANGNGLIWAVLNQSYTHLAMQQLIPQASQFPQAAAIVDRLKAMEINVQADSGVDARFQAVCNSVDDANVLAAALQAGVMYRRYQEQQSNPDLAKALDGVSIAPAGDRLKLEIPVSEEQIGGLIKSRAFVVQL